MADHSTQQVEVAGVVSISEPPEYQGAEPLDPEIDDYYYGGKGEVAWTNDAWTSSGKHESGYSDSTLRAGKSSSNDSRNGQNSSCCSPTSNTIQTPSTSDWMPAARYMADKAYEYQQRVFDLTAKLAAIEAMCAFYSHPSNQNADLRDAIGRIKGVCRREVA